MAYGNIGVGVGGVGKMWMYIETAFIPITILTIGVWIMWFGVWMSYSHSAENIGMPGMILLLVAVVATLIWIDDLVYIIFG